MNNFRSFVRETLFFSKFSFFFVHWRWVILGHLWHRITHMHLFPLSFNLNKWFSHISSFLFCVFCDFVVRMRRCVVRRPVWRLILRLVVMFVFFISKDKLQSITYSINDLSVDVADPKTWVFRWLRIYHIICRHFVVVCY